MDSKLDNILNILKSRKLKQTFQRKAIIAVFLENDKHMKPEEVFDRVKDKGIGLATVYRTLELLEEMNIVKVIGIGKDRYYELKRFSEKYVHVNFKCSICGKIYDYEDKKLVLDIVALMHYTENQYNAEINDIIVLMNGICSECRR